MLSLLLRRASVSTVVREYDYIENPKPSGYRAVHVVVAREDHLIEIQLRTTEQHRWAETVERLGSQSGHNLKDGQGPEELLHYLERAAYGTALQESGQSLPQDFLAELDWNATSDPISRAVLDTVSRWEIPHSYFADFLDAMKETPDAR